MKIISKGNSFHHINQEAGQAPKKPKRGDIARATITINRKRVIKTGKF